MFALLLTLLALTSQAWAFFRLSCSAVSIERIDPIVNPGAVSPHLHTVAGSSLFSADADYALLTGGGGCTSCGVQEDMSNYWSNNIAFRWANGSVSFLRNDEIAVYYEFSSDPTANAELVAFPDGFQMLAGDPKATTENEAVNYNCLRAAGDYTPAENSKTIPTTPCPGGIRLEIQFPSCGTGKATASDHKSHVAYPDAAGQCPKGFPEHYPAIKMETVFASEEFASLWGEAEDPDQPFVLSTGDTVGHSAHADFLNGWLDGELLNALHTCDLGGMDEGAFDPAYCLTVDKTPCFKTPSVNELIMQGPGQSSPPLDGLPGVEGTSDAEFCPTVKTMTSAGGNIWSSCAGGSASEPPKAQPSKVKDDENADTPDDTLPLKPDPADQVSSQFDVMPTSSRYPAKTSPSAIPQVTETGRGGWRGRYGDNQEQDYGQYNDGAGNNAQYHKAVVEESEASAKESEYTVSEAVVVSSASKLFGHLFLLGVLVPLAVFCL